MKRFTDEQINQARSVTVLDYVRATEPDNLQYDGGGQHSLKDNKSCKFSNGKWRDFGNDIGGYTALDYLTKYKNVPFVDAVKELIGEGAKDAYPNLNTSHSFNATSEELQTERKPFVLPEKSDNNEKAIEYLTEVRGINISIVQACIDLGVVYQSQNNNNAVFVGKEKVDTGEAKYACMRGTGETAFKQDVAGSRKIYGFCLPPETEDGNKTVAVFEAPIEALAHKTLYEMAKENGDNPTDCYRLSLGGVSSGALNHFLQEKPQVQRVILCLDNDITGEKAINRIIDELRNNTQHAGKRITIAPAKHGKDYGDTVIAVKVAQKEAREKRAIETPQKSVKKKDEERT